MIITIVGSVKSIAFLDKIPWKLCFSETVDFLTLRIKLFEFYYNIITNFNSSLWLINLFFFLLASKIRCVEYWILSTYKYYSNVLLKNRNVQERMSQKILFWKTIRDFPLKTHKFINNLTDIRIFSIMILKLTLFMEKLKFNLRNVEIST